MSDTLTVFPPFCDSSTCQISVGGSLTALSPTVWRGILNVQVWPSLSLAVWRICQYCDVILLCVLLMVSESTHSLVSWSGSDVSLFRVFTVEPFTFPMCLVLIISFFFLSISSHPVFPFLTSSLALGSFSLMSVNFVLVFFSSLGHFLSVACG